MRELIELKSRSRLIFCMLLLRFGLLVPHLCIYASISKEILVTSSFNNLSLMHNEDLVRLGYGRQAMANN